MPLIKRRPKESLKSVTFRIPESLLSRLSSYADYTNVQQTEIVIAALNYAIDSDKEFASSCITSSNTNSSAAISKNKAVSA